MCFDELVVYILLDKISFNAQYLGKFDKSKSCQFDGNFLFVTLIYVFSYMCQ